jgi:hypothetical protein
MPGVPVVDPIPVSEPHAGSAAAMKSESVEQINVGRCFWTWERKIMRGGAFIDSCSPRSELRDHVMRRDA